MYPVIHLFGVEIGTYWIMYFVGLISILVLILARRKKYNISLFKGLIFFALLTVLGTLGTKILAISENFLKHLVVGSEFSTSGLSYYGAVFCVFAFIGPCSKPLHITGQEARDLAAVCGVSQVAFMRLGCFCNGCCGGWTAHFGDTSITWPTQAIECAFDFAIVIALLKIEDLSKAKGKLYALYMLMYGAMRFFLEFLRDTEKIYFYLSDGQWCSLIAIVIGGIVLFKKKAEGEKQYDINEQ